MDDEEIQQQQRTAAAMERKLTLKLSSVPSLSSSSGGRGGGGGASASTSALYTSGRSLLSDSLSPSGKQILQDFLDDNDDTSSFANRRLSQPLSPSEQQQQQQLSQQRLSAVSSASSYSMQNSGRRSLTSERGGQSMLSKTVFARGNSDKSFVQIQCNTRPFCLKLAEQRGEMVVIGFVPDLRAGVQKGVIESTGLVLPGDVLVAVNDEMDALTSVQMTVDALMDAQLPAVLTFRRVPVVKAKLGEYTVADIERNLALRGSTLLDSHSAEDAALLVKAIIEVLDNTNTITPLMTYVSRVEKLLRRQQVTALDEETRRTQIEHIQQLMQSIYKVVELQQKDQLKKWNTVKNSNFKRIDIMSKQRASIDKKLEVMRANPLILNPDNHEIWQEYVELRHLSNQMRDSVEKSKREHFLPDFEHYSLRIGNDGIYVGLGDIWIPSFYAKFTVETRSSAPHLFFHLSTPATHGLKLRAKNFTLSTEGRLPSFHCDELNIEAQVIADVPLVYDDINGWSVPPDELHVKLMSLAYYERQANSTKKGQNHDVVMKMLINRLLPSIVRHAVQNLLCGELGPLLESRNAQMFLSGEIKIQGKKLALYDVMLNVAAQRENTNKDRALTDEAQGMMGISQDDAAILDSVFKTLTELPSAKKKTPFGFSPTTEPKKLSIRSLQNYFEQFKAFPHLKALVYELWSQTIELLSSKASSVRAPSQMPIEESSSSSSSSSSPSSLSFPLVVANMELLNEYPVNVSVSLLDMTFRLDLCEGAATYYTSLQRIIRQEMDSVSVGLSNLDSMRDGTFLENQLAALDEQYEKVNRLLAYITANVDDFGSVFRGGMPAGFMSKLFLEATDLACKGPCGGSFTIPLTDLAQLSTGQINVGTQKASNQGGKKDSSKAEKASLSALTHENGALVFSKFFLQHQQEQQEDSVNGNADDRDEETSLDTGGDGAGEKTNSAEEVLPRDRLQIRVKNTSAKVLFELPSAEELARLEASQSTSFVPFSFALVTNDGDELPQIRVETGKFAKCQYKAEQIHASGSVRQFIKRTKESAGHVLQPERSEDSNTSELESDHAGEIARDTEVENEERSAWEDYADSPFFSLKFHFFTSLQVTYEHMFWSIKSASLTEPKVAQVKHRVSLVQLLREVGMLGVTKKSNDGSAMRRRESAQFRRALLHGKQGTAKIGTRREGRNSMSSAFSDHETMFSRVSFAETNDDFDRLSDSMNSNDADSSYDHAEKEVEQALFNGIKAFEEENSGDEDSDEDSDEEEDADGDERGDDSERYEMTPAIQETSNSGGDDDDDEEVADDSSLQQGIPPEDNESSSKDRELPKSKPSPPATTIHKQTSVFF